MNRTVPFSMRLDPEIKDALQRAADADNRSLTNYIETLLRQHVAELVERRPRATRQK